MNHRGVLGVGMVLLVSLLRAAPQAPAQVPPAKVPPKLAQAKVEAARKTYEVVWKNNREGFIPFVELVYRWSRRWLEAELELSDKKADQMAAYQAHSDRMRELTRITRERFRFRANTIEEATAVEFYTTEADAWMELAKNK